MDYNISSIDEIQFGISSTEDILKRSVVAIVDTHLYESNGEPKQNGLFDSRMGVIENNKRCKTCEQNYINCPGHIGHIDLVQPMYNVLFVNEVRKILQCVCISCSKLLVNKNNPMVEMIKTKKPIERFELMYKYIKKARGKVCGTPYNSKNTDAEANKGCGATIPNKYTYQDLEYVQAEFINEIEDAETGKIRKDFKIINFPAKLTHNILRRISPEDAYILGFSPEWCMPHWLIYQVLPVVPPSVRPSIKMYNGKQSEDDLTKKYNDIVKYNNIIKESINKKLSEDKITQQLNLLQYHITVLTDNESGGVNKAMDKGGRPIKSIVQRLKGKEGRVRSNLMGKRVDFSARSVISPDPNLNIEQLGVPKDIAMNLTVPETVNKYNIDRMYQLVLNGANKFPGAKSYKKKNSNVKNLSYVDPTTITLEYGDIVNRHLMDGDYVLFNRQPSLHKMSMMAHVVKIMPGKTFRFNVDVCKPYNADFDGDEMNMHVPQSLQTSMELKYIAAVPMQIISPSKNSPIISPSQDNLLGLHIITSDKIMFKQIDVMNMLVGVVKFNGILPEPAHNNPDEGIYMWSGKQLISIILPPISFRDSACVIEKGIIKSGQIAKSQSNAIVHIIFNDYGYKEAQRYMNDLQKITTRFMIRHGFSIGISDLIIHPDIRKKNEEIIINTKKDAMNVMKEIHLNVFENISIQLNKVFESKILSIVNKSTEEITQNTFKNIEPSNRVKIMINSGSKGEKMNIQQMTALLGQQIIDGKRISLGFSHRSLPHYSRYDDGIESRGYIVNNFRDGLYPQEFFFHAMSGREGLIDTAVKTASSGYISRKLMKTMEDLKVNYNYSVRSSSGQMVQYTYGEDGFNSIYLERQSVKLIYGITEEKLNNEVLLYDNINEWEIYLTPAVIDDMKNDKHISKKIIQYNNNIFKLIDDINKLNMVYLNDKFDEDVDILFPINFDRLLLNIKITYKLEGINLSDVSPIEIYERYLTLIDELKAYNTKNRMFELLLFDKLNPVLLCKTIRITRIAFEDMIINIKKKIHGSRVDAGEMVGPVAAQSIGEISTQLTLNTFHAAGVGDKSTVNQGTPRLDELIGISTPKQPQIILFLKKEFSKSYDAADQIRFNIEIVRVGDLIISDAIYLQPTNDFANVLEDDKEHMKIYEIFSELDPQAKTVESNPWVIRLEFNQREMINKKITMEDIKLIFSYNLGSASIMYSDDNSGKLIFRLRLDFETSIKNNFDDKKYLTQQLKIIKNMIVKGLPSVKSVDKPQINKRNYIKNNNVYTTTDEYYLNVNGFGLFEILTKAYTDTLRTYSTDINEIYSVFGIEAARLFLKRELHSVFKSSRADTSHRHVGLFADIMTCRGVMMSATRSGIGSVANDIGPLAKCSFEKTIEQLKNASLYGSIDKLQGVSANIMVGQIPKCGTGYTQLLLDEDKIMNSPFSGIANEKPKQNDIDVFNSLFTTDQYCEAHKVIGFDINLINPDNIDISI